MDNFFDYKSLSSKFTFRVNIEDENDLSLVMVDAMKITTFTQTSYWLDITIFDLIGVQSSIKSLEKLLNNKSKNPSIKSNILEECEIYTLLDIALNKLFSAYEKIAQMINCVYELGLKENGFGIDVVSFDRVKRKVEEKDIELYSLFNILSDFVEFQDLKQIRNAFVHHYNPFHLSKYYVANLGENQIEFSNQMLHLQTIFPFYDEKYSDPLWLIDSINIMEKQFQEGLPKIVETINKYYNS